MKKTLFLALLIVSFLDSFSQYIPTAVQGRTWYSHGSYSGNVWTKIIAVEGDTAINGETYPLLLDKDTNLATIDTLAYLDEDTVDGTLRIDFFGGADDQLYDFSLSLGDTISYSNSSGQPELAIVSSVYQITDFRGITRKVIDFIPGPGNSCNSDMFRPWIEGLGGALLPAPLPVCDLSVIATYDLKCVFDGNTKIFGDTVQECYREKIDLEEVEISGLEFYPNPVKDMLIIEGDEPLKQVKIFNLQGSMILKIQFPQGSINVKELPAGIFILKAQYPEGKSVVWKFKKE